MTIFSSKKKNNFKVILIYQYCAINSTKIINKWSGLIQIKKWATYIDFNYAKSPTVPDDSWEENRNIKSEWQRYSLSFVPSIFIACEWDSDGAWVGPVG